MQNSTYSVTIHTSSLVCDDDLEMVAKLLMKLGNCKWTNNMGVSY